jgi:hypothetical protein
VSIDTTYGPQGEGADLSYGLGAGQQRAEASTTSTRVSISPRSDNVLISSADANRPIPEGPHDNGLTADVQEYLDPAAWLPDSFPVNSVTQVPLTSASDLNSFRDGRAPDGIMQNGGPNQS